LTNPMGGLCGRVCRHLNAHASSQKPSSSSSKSANQT